MTIIDNKTASDSYTFTEAYQEVFVIVSTVRIRSTSCTTALGFIRNSIKNFTGTATTIYEANEKVYESINGYRQLIIKLTDVNVGTKIEPAGSGNEAMAIAIVK